VELLRGREPKEYEGILQSHGIHDFRTILQAVEFLKREKEMASGKVVRDKNYLVIMIRFIIIITRMGTR